MNAKPRSDAKLLNLPPEDIEKLRNALLGGMKYADACEFAAKEFGVRVSRMTFCEFYKKECFPIVLARRANAIQESAEYAGEVKKTPAPFDEVTQDALQQRSYEIALNPDLPTAEVRALRGILLQERTVAVNERRVKLEEQRAETALRALNKFKTPAPKLNEEEFAAQLRRRFGMACQTPADRNSIRPPPPLNHLNPNLNPSPPRDPDATPNHYNLNPNPNPSPPRDPGAAPETAENPDPAVPAKPSKSTES